MVGLPQTQTNKTKFLWPSKTGGSKSMRIMWTQEQSVVLQERGGGTSCRPGELDRVLSAVMSPGLWCSHQSRICNEPQSRVEAQFGWVCVKVCMSMWERLKEVELERERERMFPAPPLVTAMGQCHGHGAGRKLRLCIINVRRGVLASSQPHSSLPVLPSQREREKERERVRERYIWGGGGGGGV